MRVRVDSVGLSRGPSARARPGHPWTGPLARRTPPATPDAVRETQRSSAASEESVRNATVGPEPRTIPPTAPYSSPATMISPSPGCSDSAASPRSLVSARAQGAHVAGPQRRHHLGRRLRGGHLGVTAQAVALGVHRGGRQTGGADGEHPVVGAARQHGRQALAPARTDGDAAGEHEGDIAAQVGGHLEQVVAGQAEPPEVVAGEEGAGGVGGASRHAAGDGDLLVDEHRHRVVDADLRAERPRRPEREVGLVARHAVRVGPGDEDRPVVRRAPR